MATKKATPAQIAARKLFAERAKAGTLTAKRKPSRDYARDAAVERAESELRLKKKIAARKKNPSTRRSAVVQNPKVRQIIEFKGHGDFAGYVIRRPGVDKWLAFFASKKDAVTLAQSVSDRTGEQLEVARVQIIGGK